MRPLALLVSGAERRFARELEPLGRYFQKIGCSVWRLNAGINPLALPWNILRARFCLKKDQTLLIVYSGHGDYLGWENLNLYIFISLSLIGMKNKLIVLNDTCYGYTFLSYLRLIRKKNTTCFISPWDSNGRTHGAVIRDALQFWPKGQIVEDVIVEHIFSPLEGPERRVPIQLRWGAELDRELSSIT